MKDLLNENINETTLVDDIADLIELSIPNDNKVVPVKNSKKTVEPDYKVPNEQIAYYIDGQVITAGVKNPNIEKHVVTINNEDIVTLKLDNYCVHLGLSDRSDVKFDVVNIRKTKNGHIFRQRIIYKDALRILKRIGYKKDHEFMYIHKTNDKVTKYNIYEEWTHKNHGVICKYLSDIVNI